MELSVEGRKFKVEALAIDGLNIPILLGEDLPLEELIGRSERSTRRCAEIDSQTEDPMDSGTQVEESSEGTLAVMTRSQKQREQRLLEEKEVAKTQAETNSEKEGKTESGTKLIGDVECFQL